MKALVGNFNQEKALVGAFSVIVKTDGSFAALVEIERWGGVICCCGSCCYGVTSPGLDHSSWKNLIKTNKNWKPTQVMKQHETSLRGRQADWCPYN